MPISEQVILDYIAAHPGAHRKDIRRNVAPDVSETTTWRAASLNYKTVRAERETPDKAALAYRDFVREAVRRSVLDWKAFRPESIMAMAAEAGIPEADRQHVADYVRQEYRRLHEGNVIRYRLRPEDLTDISRE